MLSSLRPFLSHKALRSSDRIYGSGCTRDSGGAVERLGPGLALRKAPHSFRSISHFQLGQLIPRKGFFVLLDAVSRLRPLNPPPYFVWIGSGMLRPEIDRKIALAGLGDRVRIIARTRSAGTLDCCAFCGGGPVCAPQFQRGAARSVLEAMALGKACIASRVNAILKSLSMAHRTAYHARRQQALAAAVEDLAPIQTEDKRLPKPASSSSSRRSPKRLRRVSRRNAMPPAGPGHDPHAHSQPFPQRRLRLSGVGRTAVRQLPPHSADRSGLASNSTACTSWWSQSRLFCGAESEPRAIGDQVHIAFHAEHKHAQIGEVLSSALIIYLAVGILGAGVLAASAHWIASTVLRISPGLRDTAIAGCILPRSACCLPAHSSLGAVARLCSGLTCTAGRLC